jgi:dephospho-CoA kinase
MQVTAKTPVIGLTGPVQNGKIQLTPVFEELGWRFVDLNDAIYDARPKGTPEYERLQKLIPGCLDEEGVETGRFYQNVTPNFYQTLLASYMKQVREAAEDASRKCQDGKQIVLSWEYLSRISESLPLDYMMVFHSDRETWYGRMKARAMELSNNNWEPTDEWLDNIIETLDVNPARIMEEAKRAVGPDRLIVVDVSAADWGETNLREALRQLA